MKRCDLSNGKDYRFISHHSYTHLCWVSSFQYPIAVITQMQQLISPEYCNDDDSDTALGNFA